MVKTNRSSKIKNVEKKVEHKMEKKLSLAKAEKRNLPKKNSIFRTIGGIAGGYLGGPLGARIGADASGYLAKIMGYGDYKVNHNSLLTDNGPPTFSTNGDEVVIKHREYISDVTGSINFSNGSYLVNAGNSLLFPWLSTIANNFEEYRFEGLIFEFKTTSANALNSTNTALGTVILATEYDALDANFSDKRTMEQYEFVCSTEPSSSVIHPVECKSGSNVLQHLYVTNSTTNSGVFPGDPRMYYVGNFQLATVGMQAAANIGELWVSYQVKLFKPKLNTPAGVNLPSAHYTGGVATAKCFYGFNKSPSSSLSVTTDQAGITIPTTGRYLISWFATGAVTGWTGNTTTTGDAALVYWFQNGGVADVNPQYYNNSTTTATWSAVVDITSSNNKVFPPAITVSAATYHDTFITQISSGLTLSKADSYYKQFFNRNMNKFLISQKLAVSTADSQSEQKSDNEPDSTTVASDSSSNMMRSRPTMTEYYDSGPVSPNYQEVDDDPDPMFIRVPRSTYSLLTKDLPPKRL